MAAKSTKVRGLPELIQKLNALGERETLLTIAHRATIGASKDLRDAVSANAPAGESGALKRGVATKRLVDGTRIGYTVGVRHGRKVFRGGGKDKPVDDPFYWWLLEFGTVHIAPVGFFQRAIAQMRGSALGEIQRAGVKAVLSSGNRVLKRFGNGAK